jgi:hypothetical protein
MTTAFIYKIVHIDNVEDVLYVGQTCDFPRRKREHRKNKVKEWSKYCKLYEYVDKNGGWDNFKLSLLETFEYEQDDLKWIKEAEWYDKYNPPLNQCRPGAWTLMSSNEYKKQWYEKNKKEISEKKKDEWVKNRDEINESRRNNKYICEKCGEERSMGSKKSHLLICKGKEPPTFKGPRYTCQYCKRELSTRNRSSHQTVCKTKHDISD